MQSFNRTNKFNIGDLVLVDNKNLGIIEKIIWNSIGFIIRLQNNPAYIDKTLSQYKQTLIGNNDINGLMLITLSDNIQLVDPNNMGQIGSQNIDFGLINGNIEISQGQITDTLNSIDLKYSNFLKKLKTGEFRISQIPGTNQVYRYENFPKYNLEAGQEDNYIEYIDKMINNLFGTSVEPVYVENFDKGGKSIDILGEENIENFFKLNFIEILERFDPMDTSQYYDFKNTLMYKHLIYDESIDTLSLGKEVISKIKEILLKLQKNIITDDGTKLTETTNLFDFLTFSIVGGNIEITNNTLGNDFKTITPELVPGLKHLGYQYSKPIDYGNLNEIVLQNKTPDNILINSDIINEALKIMSQEYIICLQPKVEALLWVISRLIISWYADPKLFSNIGKIKILINLFRARGLKEFNKNQGIEPIIQIFPNYGKKIATRVMSHISYFFFPYKKIGWDTSRPSYFERIDNLMYYTNGSLELKKYIQYLLKTSSEFNNPLTPDFTQINIPSIDNKIEMTLPKII